MTDTSLTRFTACNLTLLATLPIGELTATAFALEDRPLPARDAHHQAAMIQRELAVVAMFRRYVASLDQRAGHVVSERHYCLLGISLERLIAPPGKVIEALRAFLVDPALDLTPELATAAELQAANALPPDVPPLGRIMTKARTAIAGDDTPILDPLAMKALLMTQACLRAMLPISERRAALRMRTTPSDPFPLRIAQELANRVLVSGMPLSPGDRSELEGLSCLTEEYLVVAKFHGLAQVLCELRAQRAASAPVVPAILPDMTQRCLDPVSHAHAPSDR